MTQCDGVNKIQAVAIRCVTVIHFEVGHRPQIKAAGKILKHNRQDEAAFHMMIAQTIGPGWNADEGQ